MRSAATPPSATSAAILVVTVALIALVLLAIPFVAALAGMPATLPAPLQLLLAAALLLIPVSEFAIALVQKRGRICSRGRSACRGSNCSAASRTMRGPWS